LVGVQLSNKAARGRAVVCSHGSPGVWRL